jgi:hypothetical protein
MTDEPEILLPDELDESEDEIINGDDSAPLATSIIHRPTVYRRRHKSEGRTNGASGTILPVPTLAEPVWRVQPDEPPDAYAQFVEYCALVPDQRNIRNAYRAITHNPIANLVPLKFRNTVYRWRWQERAAAWDFFKVQQRGQQWMERDDARRERDYTMGEKLLDVAGDALDVISSSSLAEQPMSVARFIQLAQDLREKAIPRVSLDSPDEVKALLESLPPERAQRLRMMLLIERG